MILFFHSYSYWKRSERGSLMVTLERYRKHSVNIRIARCLWISKYKVWILWYILLNMKPTYEKCWCSPFLFLASDIVYSKKERRRLTLNRNFVGDYIGFDSNPALRALVGKSNLLLKLHPLMHCHVVDKGQHRLVYG